MRRFIESLAIDQEWFSFMRLDFKPIAYMKQCIRTESS